MTAAQIALSEHNLYCDEVQSEINARHSYQPTVIFPQTDSSLPKSQHVSTTHRHSQQLLFQTHIYNSYTTTTLLYLQTSDYSHLYVVKTHSCTVRTFTLILCWASVWRCSVSSNSCRRLLTSSTFPSRDLIWSFSNSDSSTASANCASSSDIRLSPAAHFLWVSST